MGEPPPRNQIVCQPSLSSHLCKPVMPTSVVLSHHLISGQLLSEYKPGENQSHFLSFSVFPQPPSAAQDLSCLLEPSRLVLIN